MRIATPISAPNSRYQQKTGPNVPRPNIDFKAVLAPDPQPADPGSVPDSSHTVESALVFHDSRLSIEKAEKASYNANQIGPRPTPIDMPVKDYAASQSEEPTPRPVTPRAIRTVLLAVATCVGASLFGLGEENYVETASSSSSLELVGAKRLATLYIDADDHWGAARALDDLQSDIERVTGRSPERVSKANELSKHAVIVGTLGQSQLIDQLVAEGKLDVSEIDGKWDAYRMQVVDKPVKGVDKALVIAGSNMRGVIYGIYDVSEKIGVSPWHFWADVPAKRKKALYIKGDLNLSDAPKVKYRGIFLNDEAPALTGWVTENYGNYTSEFYVHVFELLLRLKSNFLWPAMWNNAFADDDPQNMVLADKYGIVMSTSHHEPMMRADKEWNRYGEGPWDYARNPERLYEFWKDGAERNKPYESIYTLGMRGQQDTPMSETEDVELLERIVDDQREILTEVFSERDITEVPQVWALYKEVQGYYEKGMRVPDDVILLWCDDNWGNIRRLPTPEERKRPGGAGVYYHFDYVGGPRSYRWINTIQLAKIWEQMNLAYRYEANQIWLTNVGDLKPMEFPIEFFLDLAWDIEDWPKERIETYGQLWATREFGEKHASEIAALLAGYTRHNARRKPELQEAGTYSLLNYREAERISAELSDLTARSETLYKSIGEEYKDAFFQLVHYPVKASGIITQMYIAQAKNHLYGQQGRATTNDFAKQVENYFQANSDLAEVYHNEIADGKWNHMMSQPRIGYTHWNNPPADTMPPIMLNKPHSHPDMGVAIEGMREAWPQEGVNYALPAFHRYGQPNRYIEIFNKGTAPFDFEITTAEPWIVLSKEKGTLRDSQRVLVSIDWDAVPSEKASSHILVRGTGWGGARIAIDAVKQDGALKGFIEADGFVSIDAPNVSRKGDVEGFSWKTIPQLGRSDASISVFPITDRSFTDPKSAPYVEYDLTLFNVGEITVEAHFAPTLPFVPGRGIRYAIGFDDETPQVVDFLAETSEYHWAESVRNAVRKSLSRHTIEEPGHHTLRVYMVDPAATLQKLIINTGGVKPSYLGPPQSQHADSL